MGPLLRIVPDADREVLLFLLVLLYNKKGVLGGVVMMNGRAYRSGRALKRKEWLWLANILLLKIT
jgi:hypothetical protein